MSAAAAALGPPSDGGGGRWSTLARLGGLIYTVRIPHECRPGARELEGVEFPTLVAPAMIAHLAAELARQEGGGAAVWRAVSTLVPGRERLALTERLGVVGDPLTLPVLRAGMLEAVRALAALIPRPAAGGRSTPVQIAGRTYTATIPAGLAGMPAQVLAAEGGRVPLTLAGGRRPAGPGMLGLLLFDEATLSDLDGRVGDPADPCTSHDVITGVHAALEALAAGEAVPDEVAMDATPTELAFADRASSVRVDLGEHSYQIAYPPVWPAFVDLVAGMGPLMHPAPGVARAVQAEGLAARCAAAMPLVFAPADVEAIAASLAFDRLEVFAVGGALMLALVGLDAEAVHATGRAEGAVAASVAHLATARAGRDGGGGAGM